MSNLNNFLNSLKANSPLEAINNIKIELAVRARESVSSIQNNVASKFKFTPIKEQKEGE